jgi:hypothetical protein
MARRWRGPSMCLGYLAGEDRDLVSHLVLRVFWLTAAMRSVRCHSIRGCTAALLSGLLLAAAAGYGLVQISE